MTQRVLVAISSRTVRRGLSMTLHEQGYTVTDVSTITDVVACLGQTPHQAAIIGPYLDDGTGAACLKKIRALPALDEVQLLLAYDATAAAPVATQDADAHVPWPLAHDEVLAKLQALLNPVAVARPHRILVIDDSPTILANLQMMLDEEGLDVTTATSGEEGLMLASQDVPDAIIIDANMPGLKGTEVIQRMRQDPELRDVPCILLTGSEKEFSELSALEAGADAYVRKDAIRTLLMVRLQALLRSHEQAQVSQRNLTTVGFVAADAAGLEPLLKQLRTEGFHTPVFPTWQAAFDTDGHSEAVALIFVTGREDDWRAAKVRGEAQPVMIAVFLPDGDGGRATAFQSGADEVLLMSENVDVQAGRIRALARRARSEIGRRIDQKRELQRQVAEAESRAAVALAEAREAMVRDLAMKNEELAEARDKAERASQAKTSFLANMSHELRTPLTAVIGLAEILLEEAQKRQIQDFVNDLSTIRQSGRHLLGLISDILDLSKIEANKLEPERMRFDLEPLLTDIENILGAQAQAKGLTFQVERMYPLPRQVVSDAMRVRQILFNLIGNAMKFTTRGGVRLVVKFAGAEDMLHLEVHDTGPGLTPAQQVSIFKPFEQADSTVTRKFGGTGLGLTLSRQLAELLGGDLTVTSEVGVGSCFTATIDTGAIPEGEMVTSKTPAHVAAETTLEIPDLTGVRILLAEDTPTNQRLITHFIRETGASIKVVANGEDAVEAAIGGEHDLVLMDIQMPVLDGVGATEMLRAVGFGRPIIALTANVLKEDVDRYLAVGFNDTLAKPIERVRFYATLGKHGLPLKRAENAAPEPVSDAVLDLVQEFLASLPVDMAAIEKAHSAQDWPALRASAHALRGIAGSLGYPEITTYAGAIEDHIRKDNLPAASEAFASLQAIVATTIGMAAC